jgi:arsenate reductase
VKLKVYEYANCSTCKKALKFLDARKVAYEKIPIVEQPPTMAELRAMLKVVGDFRRLFDTSGLLYREMKIGDRIKAGMTEAEAISLLAKHGKLIKRPFVVAGAKGAVGFKEAEWKALT